jgi:hypothetical protein
MCQCEKFNWFDSGKDHWRALV